MKTATYTGAGVGSPGTFGDATNAVTVTVSGTGAVTAIASAPISFPSSVTNVTAGTGINVGAGPGGAITSTGTLNLSNVGTAGTYGSATLVPVVTTDAQGRVTAASNTAITFPASLTSVTSGTGITCTPNPITSTGTVALTSPFSTNPFASVGNATNVAQITTDATGRVQTATSVPISFPAAVTAVTAGTGLNVGAGPGGTISTTGTLNLANTAVGAGTYGSATTVGTFTVDTQGRLNNASNVGITFPTATISTQDEGVAVQANCSVINFAGTNISAAVDGAGKTTVTVSNPSALHHFIGRKPIAANVALAVNDIVNYPTIVANVGGMYNNGTQGPAGTATVTVPVAGLYAVSLSVQRGAADGGLFVDINNANPFCYVNSINFAATPPVLSSSAHVVLAASDVLRVKVIDAFTLGATVAASNQWSVVRLT